MPGRYTDQERASIMANRRARGAGLKYGYTYNQQGYNDAPDQGGSAFRLGENWKQFGRFGGDGTWQQRIGPGGTVQWKARSQNPDRVKDTGGDWFDAPAAAQRSYQNTHGENGFFTQHPDATWQDWAIYKGGQQQTKAQGWKQDANGNWVNPNNQYDMRDAQFRRLSQEGGMMNNTGTTNWSGANQQYGQPGLAPAPQPQTAPPPAAPATPAPPTGPGIPDIGDLNQGIAAGEPAPGTGLPDYGNPYKKRKNLGNLAFGSDF